MSWNIAATGSVAAVRHHMEAVNVNNDQSGEAVKRLIAEVLEAMTPTFSGARVRAYGHLDRFSSNVHLEIEGVQLILDEPAPEAAPAEPQA